jgi:hypothetical protein
VKYHRAQDTFVGDLKDGTSVRVVKGEVLPEGHELVKRDQAGSGTLFRPLDEGGEEPEAKPSAASRAAAKVTGKAT